jgi:hypothetical protein
VQTVAALTHLDAAANSLFARLTRPTLMGNDPPVIVPGPSTERIGTLKDHEQPADDAETIRALCECLFAAAAEHQPPRRLAGGSFDETCGQPDRIEVLVPYSWLAPDLRAKLTPGIEGNLGRKLLQMRIHCSPTIDINLGKSFRLSMPRDVAGLSWDEFLRRCSEPEHE